MKRRPHPFLPLLAVLVLALAARSASAVEASPYGVNVHLPQGEELTKLFDQAQAAGIGWVRIDFVWAYVEPVKDRYDWRIYDAIAAAARERGLEVYATIAYGPVWATGGPELIGVPNDPEEWAQFCFLAAKRYRGKIRYWGMWNEPNLDHFWAGSRQQYIDIILKPGADAIHAANPDAKVGGPDLAHLTSGDSDWYRWLYDTLRQAGDKLDFVTHHIYDSDSHRDVTEKLEASTLFGNKPDLWDAVTPSVKEVLKAAGWWGKPFWLTETGWESGGGESKQADELRGLFDDWTTGRSGRDWVQKIFVYEIQDPAGGGSTWGLLRADGTPKPGWFAYRGVTAVNEGSRALSLQGGRFSVSAAWREPRSGATGYGQPIADSDQSGFFWFFDASNVELVVKLLDGRGSNGAFWVFYGALSDVEYWITVTDRQTGAVKVYHNLPGTLCGRGDTRAFPASGTPGKTAAGAAPLADPLPLEIGQIAEGSCAESSGTLCLLGSRFRVQARFTDPRNGVQGLAMASPRTDQSGTFWFFDPSNVELVVKVLDGRALTGHFWVFYGALSNVEYWITVTDTVTGLSKEYHNVRGNLCGKGDTSAL
jgi:hypothetical protein